MKRLYAYISPAGTFYIYRVRRYYIAYFGSRLIDSYGSAEEAACAAAASRHLTLPEGMMFDELRVPADLSRWEGFD